MPLSEYKFIVPEEETSEEKLDRLKTELISMEENYYRMLQEGISSEKLDVLAVKIEAKRNVYEDAGGTYPEL
tara:strand:+ start:820 stop:1035 length:216 start_codon:yes stop_codon:yes gene_type:complete